jgi:SOS-response transcriptional repressor LexA
MDNTKDRLKELIKAYGMGQNKFEAKCGLANGTINNSRGGVSSLTLEKISNTYPEVNIEWLVSGIGEMFKDVPVKSYTEGIPYYNVDFEMGFDLMVNDQTANPEYNISFAPYNKCDVWCNARGNSMYPTIASGDIIALKEVRDFSFLVSDEIYAIVTSNGLRTIKRLRDAGEDYVLIPDNKNFSEQRINKSLVTKVYQVKGCMKMF